MAAFVLGNGTSRGSIDVELLLKIAPVYGCNALYRTYTPTVLVSTDRPISQQIQESGYAKTNRFYTRRPLHNSGAQTVPREYFGFSSGPIATALATQSAIAIELVNPGDSMPNKFTKPATPCVAGPWIRKSAAGAFGPLILGRMPA